MIILRQRIIQQWNEVCPLLLRGILELVDHKVRIGIARLLVNEWSIIAANQPIQQTVGL
jgi:hypothetical protein